MRFGFHQRRFPIVAPLQQADSMLLSWDGTLAVARRSPPECNVEPAISVTSGNEMNKKLAAYVIGHITVRDAQKWAEYCRKVPATLEPWGGVLIFRGSRAAVYSGEHAHTDTVAIGFPDTAVADNWFRSPEYQALVPLRMEAADVDLISYRSTS
jgi:uncharacterized protein (DUF1330 family)